VTEHTQPAARPWPPLLNRPTVVIATQDAPRSTPGMESAADQGITAITLLGADSRDPLDYGRKLAALWPGPRDLVLIGQDVRAPAGIIEDFAACPADWCIVVDQNGASPGGSWINMCKFSAAFQRRHPLLATQATCLSATGPDCCVPAWNIPDYYVRAILATGTAFHPHTRPAASSAG
jgi:hypothetical protein